ncbi:MAG: (2Fe-2S)-binding protein [Pseudomonadota bacterium]|jgi:isoquinoline 1-oxidoreductase alpha subunit
MITLNVNGKEHQVDVDADTPLLWVLRDELKLTGSKFSCGIGVCGACTVLMNGQPIRSCVLPVSAVAAGATLVTIEGLSPDRSHRVQKAWLEESVPQCGYCQSGMILSAVALLDRIAHPTDTDIDTAMTNLCRCGTYDGVRKAIHKAAKSPKL